MSCHISFGAYKCVKVLGHVKIVYVIAFQLLAFNYIRGITNTALALSVCLIWIKVDLYADKVCCEEKGR